LAPPHSRLRQPAAPDARPWPSSPPCFPYTPLFRSYFAPLDDYKKHVMTINAIGQELDRHAAQLVQTAAELQRTQYVLRDEDSTQSRILQIVAVLGALALGILAAAMISRQITQPLQETLEIAKRIADGDLTSETRVTRRDELGALQRGIQD